MARIGTTALNVLSGGVTYSYYPYPEAEIDIKGADFKKYNYIKDGIQYSIPMKKNADSHFHFRFNNNDYGAVGLDANISLTIQYDGDGDPHPYSVSTDIRLSDTFSIVAKTNSEDDWTTFGEIEYGSGEVLADEWVPGDEVFFLGIIKSGGLFRARVYIDLRPNGSTLEVNTRLFNNATGMPITLKAGYIEISENNGPWEHILDVGESEQEYILVGSKWGTGIVSVRYSIPGWYDETIIKAQMVAIGTSTVTETFITPFTGSDLIATGSMATPESSRQEGVTATVTAIIPSQYV